jgi:hypothetical protein
MSVDLAIWAAAAGATGSVVSAVAALWKTVGEKSAVSKQIETAFSQPHDASGMPPAFDVFLSYATADSKDFASELARALKSYGVSVWFDQDQIRVGDNTIAKIGEGLNTSKYALVILSPRFLDSAWPALELKALLRRETEDQRKILPVWHGVSHDDVMRHSPSLATKLALRSDSETIEEIAFDVARITGSALQS